MPQKPISLGILNTGSLLVSLLSHCLTGRLEETGESRLLVSYIFGQNLALPTDAEGRSKWAARTGHIRGSPWRKRNNAAQYRED